MWHEAAVMVGRIVVGEPVGPSGPGAQPSDYGVGKPGTDGWRHVPEAARQTFPSVARILAEGRSRLGNCERQEHAAALIEIAKIAGHRFDDFLRDANPIHSARTRNPIRSQP